MQQNLAISADGERLTIGREAQRGDHGSLVIDRRLTRHNLGWRIVLGAGADPIANSRDVSRGERRLAHWHRRLHRSRDELDDETLFGRPGHKRRSAFTAGLEPGVRREIEVRLFQRGLMTTGAVLLENWLDIAAEFDRLGLWVLCLGRRLRDVYQHRT